MILFNRGLVRSRVISLVWRHEIQKAFRPIAGIVITVFCIFALSGKRAGAVYLLERGDKNDQRTRRWRRPNRTYKQVWMSTYLFVYLMAENTATHVDTIAGQQGMYMNTSTIFTDHYHDYHHHIVFIVNLIIKQSIRQRIAQNSKLRPKDTTCSSICL